MLPAGLIVVYLNSTIILGGDIVLDIFLSYCQKDSMYADDIDSYFNNKTLCIHRDIRDIPNWSSIKEFMRKISKMDYAILIITENYLKSFNCMFEVLEVMKDSEYRRKIFPVVADCNIYSPEARISYVTYWQERLKELANQLKAVDIVNLGALPDDLKRTQNIASSISEFLCIVSDMNNPNVSNVNEAVEIKLKKVGLMNEQVSSSTRETSSMDLFSTLNIPKTNYPEEVTDLQKNQFMVRSFKEVNQLLTQLCNQFQEENRAYQVTVEKIDTRNCIYQFYKNGRQLRGIKVFLSNMFGGKDVSIGISADMYSMGTNNSWNGMYSVSTDNGQLKLCATLSMSNNQELMDVEDVVRDIWTSYIQPYLNSVC